MYFRLTRVLFALWLFVPPVQAEQTQNEPILTFTPSKCVALREGKNCYADIKVVWQMAYVSDFCIRKQADKSIVRCWQNMQQGTHKYTFNSTITVNYELIDMRSGQVFGNSKIDVSWVYTNKQKKRRWRLF